MVDLAIFLKQNGHDVLVIALGKTSEVHLGTTPDRNLLTRQLDAASVPWKCGQARNWRSLLASLGWLRRELGRFQPEVVQSMLFHANVVTALANRSLCVPHFGGERVRPVPSWRKWMMRGIVGNMEKLVCVSQGIVEDYRRWPTIPAEKLMVIPNGIPLEKIAKQELGGPEQSLRPDSTHRTEIVRLWPETVPRDLLNPDVPIVLFVGRLSDQKGIEGLMLHAEELLTRIPDAHLVVLGDGPLKARVQWLASGLSVLSRIHLLGWQPNIQQWMQASNILLLPSNYEGMPNVVLEAMSTARPVVCFDVEGVHELLGEHARDQVVRRADWGHFLHKVQTIVRDRPLAAQLGSSNLSRVRQKFLQSDQLLQYERLYMTVATKT